ncbi:MAG: helix-turn-helix transcriptional regulator [Clostridia bacterium]|nr:helix-turn-helix transcriptional regulator [Clostridia bacterium]
MKTVDLLKLSEMENLAVSSLFSMKQFWKEGHTYVMKAPRKQNALLWFCGCEGTFTFKTGSVLPVPRGALVSIPQGSEYSVRFLHCDGTPVTLLVEFCLFSEQPLCISSEIEILEKSLTDMEVIAILTRLPSYFSMPSRPMLEIQSDLYKLLSLLALRKERRIIRRRGLQTIEKGIRYLQTDEKQTLSVEEIARSCFVTPAYFRRLFKEYTGMSPSEYRAKRKAEQAKTLLLHTDLSVAEIAGQLGYDNPSYFCRAFKKETGTAPTEYQKAMGNSIEK